MPPLAKLTDGSRIIVTTREALTCPKCSKKFDITDVSFGAVIECPHCNNITWRPEYKPRWYFRVRNFIFSNLASFIIVFLSSLLATCAHEGKFQAGEGDANAVRCLQ